MASATTSPADRRAYRGDFPREGGVFLSTADFEALIGELDTLRREVADARAARSGGAQDDATLHEPGRMATVNGGAGLGSIVRVADRAGRESTYELTGRPIADAPQKVTLGSPEGQALLGARPGDRVQITPGNGRRRRVRVLDVQPVAPVRLFDE